MDYYCERCKEYIVAPIKGVFNHPHEKQRECYVCPRCGQMVYPRSKAEPLPV